MIEREMFSDLCYFSYFKEGMFFYGLCIGNNKKLVIWVCKGFLVDEG